LKLIILAAGIGTRLRSANNNIPKCLIKYNGKPNLQRIVSFAESNNIEIGDMLIVVGEKGKCWTSENTKQIQSIIPNLITNKYNDTTNNAYSLRLVLDAISKNDLLIMDGDLFIDDSELLAKFIHSKQSCILGKKAEKNFKNRNLIKTNGNNRVVEFGKNLDMMAEVIIYGPLLKILKSDYSIFVDILKSTQYDFSNIDRILEKFVIETEVRVIIEDTWLNVNKPKDLNLLDQNQ